MTKEIKCRKLSRVGEEIAGKIEWGGNSLSGEEPGGVGGGGGSGDVFGIGHGGCGVLE